MKVHKNKQIRRKMTRSIKLKKKRKSRISKYIKKTVKKMTGNEKKTQGK